MTGQDIDERTLRDNRFERAQIPLSSSLSLQAFGIEASVFVACVELTEGARSGRRRRILSS